MKYTLVNHIVSVSKCPKIDLEILIGFVVKQKTNKKNLLFRLGKEIFCNVFVFNGWKR
jgi:hypothetical protein